MQTKRQHEIHAYVGAPSLTATLLALVVSAFAATAASAHVTSTRAQRSAASALAMHARILRPGQGFASAGSPAVRDLQRLLATAGYPPGRIDGRYGPRTTSAVVRYQANSGLRVDGVAGPLTLAALTGRGVVLGPGAGYSSGGSPVVRDLQRRLAAAGYSPGPFDGRYGPRTERAVRRYQAQAGLPVNGLAGSRMFAHLRQRSQGKHSAVSHTTGAPPKTAAAASPAPATPAPTPSPPTATAPAAPPTATAPAAPAPAAPAQAEARRVDHSISMGWIWLLALLSVGLAVGVHRHVRRHPGDSRQKAASLGREAKNLTVDLGRKAARAAAHLGQMAASAGRSAAGLAAALWRKTPGWTAGLRQRIASLAASLWRRTPILAADLSHRTGNLAAGLSHRTADLAASLSRQAASVGQKTAGLRRQAPVGQRPTFGYQAAARSKRPETPDIKGVVASGAREHRPPRRNGNPGGIKASATDINAAFNLGVLLEERRDLPAAEAAYRRADEGGHAAASSNLGVLLEGQGDRTGAEAAYRRADQRGEANGSFNLGVLLEETDDLAGAEAAYRRAEGSAEGKVAQLARAARLELTASIGVSGVAHNGGDVDGT